MIKAIVFDLDNTLVDFMRMKRVCCEAAMDAMISSGLKISRAKGLKIMFDLYSKHGFENAKIFQIFMKTVHGKIDYGIMASGIVAYRRVREGIIYPYPNVVSTLDALHKKYKIAILSDAPRIQAWLRLACMGIQSKFDAVVTFDDTKVRKPSDKPFLFVLKKLGLKADECLMVGDSLKRDMAASRLGFKTVFARYGGNAEPARIKPDYVIDDISELLKI
jgi:putative hydrolase of the HAD superfamily